MPDKTANYSKGKNSNKIKNRKNAHGKYHPERKIKKKTAQADKRAKKAISEYFQESEPLTITPSKRQPDSPAKQKKKVNNRPIRIAFLGGLNEVGKNMTLYEYNDEMIIVDCGLAFPDADMPGVDLVLPDFTYVERYAYKIKGVFVTHGHEDHIGGLAYLLGTLNIPIYATRLTIGLIQGKLSEHGLLKTAKLHVVSPGERVNTGSFEIEFIHVNHSIPDAVAFAIRCEGGTVVHMGDFKIDTTPIDGEPINLGRFAEIGNEGVLCLLSDSTNAEREGYTPSEKKVGETFDLLFRRAGNRRIIVATFASNIHRVQQIINTAQTLGRKVCLSGRSLENVVNIAKELGYINVPQDIIVSLDRINHYPSDKMVVITTGSQGEPMSALTRMAFSDHKHVAINASDYIIISATPIPGNEKTVGRVINELMKLGAEVIYEKMYEVHVSGHACREELKMIMGLLKPRYFIPVHGEQKHLQKHKQIAVSMGIPESNIVIADNGRLIEMNRKGIANIGSVPAGVVFVDGAGSSDIDSVVLRERRRMSQDGMITVVAVIDSEGYIVSGPEIISRGFIYVKEAEKLMNEIQKTAYEILDARLEKDPSDLNGAKSKVRDDLSRFIYERTRKSPIIVPVIMQS